MKNHITTYRYVHYNVTNHERYTTHAHTYSHTQDKRIQYSKKTDYSTIRHGMYFFINIIPYSTVSTMYYSVSHWYWYRYRYRYRTRCGTKNIFFQNSTGTLPVPVQYYQRLLVILSGSSQASSQQPTNILKFLLVSFQSLLR